MKLASIPALALALVATAAAAHPGGVDKNGCHTNSETGEYHCHKKKPPKKATQAVQCVPERDASGRIKRDYRQRRAFIEAHPCPVTGSTDYRQPCPGWDVDHIVPLACCGADHPSNMQWTLTEVNRAKGAKCPSPPAADPVPATSR